MSKRLFAFLIIISIVLGGCGGTSSSREKDKTSISSTVNLQEGADSTEASDFDEDLTDSGDEQDSNTYEVNEVNAALGLEETITMYAEFLKKIYDADPDKMSNLRYDLVYVDEDDIPELIYMEDSYHACTVHMCLAYKDGVFEIGEFGEYGSFSYVPGKGIILSYYMGMGSYLYDYFCLENRTLREEKYFEASESYDGSGEVTYYIDGDKVNEDTYQEEISNYRKYNFVTADHYGAFSYKESYDVYDILINYAKSGVRPHTVPVSNQVLEAVGQYSAYAFSTNRNESKDINSYEGGLYAGFSMTEDGYVSIWYGNSEISVADYAMPIVQYMDALSIVEKGGSWGIAAKSEDLYREYMIYMLPGKKLRIEVFDSELKFGEGQLNFWFEEVDYEND